MPVYLIRAGEHGPVKIGFAKDPLRRIEDLQVANHETLYVLRILDGGLDTEAMLHARFSSLCVRGEWFTFHADMLGELGATEWHQPAKPTWEDVWTPERRAARSEKVRASHQDPARGAKFKATMAKKRELESAKESARKGIFFNVSAHEELSAPHILSSL